MKKVIKEIIRQKVAIGVGLFLLFIASVIIVTEEVGYRNEIPNELKAKERVSNMLVEILFNL